MSHMYRTSYIYHSIIKLNLVTEKALAEIIILDIREIYDVNSVKTLTVVDDRIRGSRYLFLTLRNLQIWSRMF